MIEVERRKKKKKVELKLCLCIIFTSLNIILLLSENNKARSPALELGVFLVIFRLQAENYSFIPYDIILLSDDQVIVKQNYQMTKNICISSIMKYLRINPST